MNVVLTPAMRWVVRGLIVAFVFLVVNSAYLLTVSFAGRVTGEDHQTVFSIWMLLAHVVVGLAVALPFLVVGVAHARRALSRPNRPAKRAGLAAFTAGLATVVTGVFLIRPEVGEYALSTRDLIPRDALWWLHLAAPLGLVWMYLLHRLAGPRIRWRMGGALLIGAVVAGGAGVFLHGSLTGKVEEVAPSSGDSYFDPSLARTDTGNFIPASSLMQNDECASCHPDAHATWAASVHAASSFNNPIYAFSVRETRERAFAREGTTKDSRFCAGCHDPVPFFSGAFEDRKWDDPAYDAAHDPVGAASLTCIACHAISHINSPRGNADYIISQPAEYPFAGSSSGWLSWINHQLIRARPGLHKRTFLKPEVHRTSEFCGACHKVFLPEDLNDYRWLRGQNHYDSFRLSGVSGVSAQSWYYPPSAKDRCSDCHMLPLPSEDPAAKPLTVGGDLALMDHRFAAANTAAPVLAELPGCEGAFDACAAFTAGVMRVDLFGVREGGEVDGALHAPLRPEVPTLERGKRYLLETVVRNVSVGHEFTQGTADSNEVWLDVEVTSGGRVVGRSGGVSERAEVDPWSKFLNAYVIDRDGNRIERRNPQDIFVTLYNHQVPPGAADVTHFAITVPSDAADEMRVRVSLRYRKFDAILYAAAMGKDRIDDLPVLTLATDEVTFPVAAAPETAGSAVQTFPPSADPWIRWYDYGIGLFRQGERLGAKGDLRQAEMAFAQTESLGKVHGTLGRARAALREGRLDDAAARLREAAAATPPADPWSVRWFSALVNRQQGALDAAAADLEKLIASEFPGSAARGFDFGKDDRVLVELGTVLLEQARADPTGTATLAQRARGLAQQALAMDPESVSAWYLLAQSATALGETAAADAALRQHARYKPDDNARDRAVNLARLRDPAANHAAEAIVIYDLDREGRPVRSIMEFAKHPRDPEP